MAEPCGAGDFTEEDTSLLTTIDSAIEESAELFEAVELRAALRKGMEAAQAANNISMQQSHGNYQLDPDRAKTILFVALSAINGMRVMLSPFLPFTSNSTIF